MGKGSHGGHHRHHHHHHHRRGPGLGLGLMVGGAIGYGIARRGHRRRGRTVMVVNPPPPPPMVVSKVQIPCYSDEEGSTMYHISVNTYSGHSWEIAARYSAFEKLYDSLKYSRMNVAFPWSMPIRSFFGLSEHAKNGRRIELERWLDCALQFSQHQPWMRLHVNCFLQVPQMLLSSTNASASSPVVTAEEIRESTSQAGARTVQVAMPANVQVGEMLEIEVNGETFYIPAPGDVPPGSSFNVRLPESVPLVATEVRVIGEGIQHDDAANRAPVPVVAVDDAPYLAKSAANPF